MARRGSHDLAVGGMFGLALLVLALAVMAVGGESGWLFRRVSYYVVFPNADGLLNGAPVKMAGVSVGTVTGIRLPTDPTGSGIRVEIGVDPLYSERVREDSRATLRILQLLTNEKFVEIVPGQSGAVLAEGAEITRQVETGVLERGELIAEDVSAITVSLKNILAQLEQGEGLLGQMLRDPEFGHKGLEALGKTLENTQQLTTDLREGKGTIGRLLHDEALAAKLDDLARAVVDLAALLEAVGGEDSALREMFAAGGSAEQAVADLQSAAARMNQLVGRLESDEGLLGRLLNDTDYSRKLADDLAAALGNAAEITRKVNEGEGSLGALVNERVLYEGAEDVVAGVNDSKFARWLLRHYQKKGIKSQDEKGQPPPAQPPGEPEVD